MLQGATDLAESERGIFSIFLVLAVTALVVFGKITGDQWIEFMKWIAVTLIAGKTVSHAVETLRPKASEA